VKRLYAIVAAAGVLIVLVVAFVARELSPVRRAESMLRDMRGEPPEGIDALLRSAGLSENKFTDPSKTRERAKALAALGPRIIPLLRRELEGQMKAALAAAHALGSLGPEGRRVLCESFGHSDSGVRSAAYSGWGWPRKGGLDGACIQILSDHLRDSRPDVRKYALHGLESQDTSPALHRRIVEMLQQDPAPAVRRAAALALGRSNAPAELRRRLLLETILDGQEDPHVRGGAMIAIKSVRCPLARVVPAYVRALEDEATEARIVAAGMLGRLLWLDAIDSKEARSAFSALRRATRDPSARVRGSAAEALGQMSIAGVNIRDAVQDLQRLARDADPDVSKRAQWALRRHAYQGSGESDPARNRAPWDFSE
jgi:HEAT repeat protein